MPERFHTLERHTEREREERGKGEGVGVLSVTVTLQCFQCISKLVPDFLEGLIIAHVRPRLMQTIAEKRKRVCHVVDGKVAGT